MEYIGLYGKKIENPVFYCRSHEVFLTSEDVEAKKCLCKPTKDMISTQKCQWLVPMDEYDEFRKKRNEANNIYKKNRKKRYNLYQPANKYRDTVKKLLKENENGQGL